MSPDVKFLIPFGQTLPAHSCYLCLINGAE
jgi:hypothetical protein